MKSSAIDSINFTREAFLHPVNLGFLFLAALSAFFLNDIPMAANLIFTMTLGVELIFLGTVPRLESFRKYVTARILREQPRNLEEKEIFYNLSSQSQKRFLVLKHISDKVEANFRKFPDTSQGLTDNIRMKIQELLSNYVFMLDSYERYGTYTKTTRNQDIQREIQAVAKELSELESEKLREIKNRRLLILRKREEKLEKARERLKICESQLETIEDAVRYIYEQSITMSNPEHIGLQLDTLLHDVEETVSIVEDLDADVLPGLNLIEKMDNFEQNADIGSPARSRVSN